MLRLMSAIVFSMSLATASMAGPVADFAAKAEELAKSDPVAALAALDQAIEEVWNASPLLLRKALFVDSASGFGVYAERSGSVFKQGEPIVVYGEPLGFAYGKNLIGGMEINLAVDLALLDGSGTELGAQKDFGEFVLPVRYHNREFQITLTVNLPGFPAGKYLARFTLRDRHSEKTATFELPFEITG